MKELIDNILKAEQQAEKIIAQAKEQASKIAADSAIEIEEIHRIAEQDVKDARRMAILNANNQADKLYEKRLAAAREEGEKMIENAEQKTQKAAEFIVGRILA